VQGVHAGHRDVDQEVVAAGHNEHRQYPESRRVPSGVHLSPNNIGYLAAKASRGLHTIDVPSPFTARQRGRLLQE
jgi:hypothetical protein